MYKTPKSPSLVNSPNSSLYLLLYSSSLSCRQTPKTSVHFFTGPGLMLPSFAAAFSGFYFGGGKNAKKQQPEMVL